MLKELISLANHLDGKGFEKEADRLDRVITKLSSEEGDDMFNLLSDTYTFRGDDKIVEDEDYLRILTKDEADQEAVWYKILDLISEYGMSEEELLNLVIKNSESSYAKELRGSEPKDYSQLIDEDEELDAAWMPSGPGIL